MTDLITKDFKPHQNYDWMHNAYVVEKKTIKEIANQLHISTKLVNIMIKEHGLKK